MNNLELLDKFLIMETQANLFDIQISRIKIWQFIRNEIYGEILRKKFNIDKSGKSDKEAGFYLHLNGMINFVLNSIKILLKPPKQSEVLVFCHPRRKRENSFYEDIYTDPLLRNFPFSFVVLESFFKLSHLRPVQTKNLYYLDFIEYPSRFSSYIKRHKINCKEKEIIKDIESILMKNFNLKVNLFNLVNKILVRYSFIYPKLKSLFIRIRPKVVIEVVNYNFISQIANCICKELKISSIELQHGVMSNYHIGYNYSEIIKPESFPNYIFVWGDYWKHNSRFPIHNNNIISCGFPFLENAVKKYSKDLSKKIIVLSQGPIGKKLSDIIFDLSRRDLMKEHTFIYKIHPAEKSIAKIKYKKLYSSKNIKVIDDDKTDLYELFAESEFQIGVHSTAIIEGIEFGLKTIIIKLPGWKYFKTFEDEEGIYFVQSPLEMEKIISSRKDKIISSKLTEKFWERDSLNKIINKISTIANHKK